MPDTIDNRELLGKKAIAEPKGEPEIGIDLGDELMRKLVDSVDENQYGHGVDMSELERFIGIAQTREQMYALIDLMATDERIRAILDTYTEDTIETNENGQIVWCESSDDNVLKFVNYLLAALKIDENSEEWVRSLIKYGDLYLRLYRQSDYDEEDIFDSSRDEREDYERTLNEAYNPDVGEPTGGEPKPLREDVLVNVHAPNDHFVHYAEKVDNPAEMFDLTKLGTTRGFIKAPVAVQSNYDTFEQVASPYVSYKMKSKDVTVFSATDFVHATLNSNTSRNPEEVQIFRDDEAYKAGRGTTYKVNRGQSLLYSQFKVWRELSLLENSVMLSRLTRSALVRILNVEVGDMGKEKAMSTVSRIKQNIEQRSAFKVGQGMSEYTNPGPIENAIYIPTHEGKGAITASTLGGDYDPRQLTDLEYFQNKLYGAFRVPKQFFNQTDDGAGFNGGASLTIISSRYGKAIKSIQKTYCQLITNLINILLWDKGLKSYINRFTIRMQAPITQEELDRRENIRNRMGVNQDVMNLVNGVVDDDITKARIVKSLLAQSLTNPEVTDLLQGYIDKLEEAREAEEAEAKSDNDSPAPAPATRDESPADSFEREIGFTNEEPSEEPIGEPEGEPSGEAPATDTGETTNPAMGEGDSYLPSPAEVGQNMVDNI